MDRTSLDFKFFGGLEEQLRKALAKRPGRRKVCFFPYIGGKFHLLKTLVPLIPQHRIFVEVFGGAANLLLNKPPSSIEVYNDLNGDLVNLFLVVRDHQRKFIDRFKWVFYSRGLYDRWLKGPPPEDPIERAVRFYYILRCSFSGSYGASIRYKRQPGKPAPNTLWSALDDTEQISERLKNCYIECLDFRRCIKNWDTPETFFFVDPPYYGLQYYEQKFSPKDHTELQETLGKTRGKWLLTYNDDPWVGEAYAKFSITEARMTKAASYKSHGERRTKFTNLIIANYPLTKNQTIDGG